MQKALNRLEKRSAVVASDEQRRCGVTHHPACTWALAGSVSMDDAVARF